MGRTLTHFDVKPNLRMLLSVDLIATFASFRRLNYKCAGCVFIPGFQIGSGGSQIINHSHGWSGFQIVSGDSRVVIPIHGWTAC